MYTLAIHGGAGTILPSLMTSKKEEAYKTALSNALNTGRKILENGGSAIDSVEACVVSLENCNLFNAGLGSVFTNNNSNEMDASIMEGKYLKAGAVAGIKNIKNPVEFFGNKFDFFS